MLAVGVDPRAIGQTPDNVVFPCIFLVGVRWLTCCPLEPKARKEERISVSPSIPSSHCSENDVSIGSLGCISTGDTVDCFFSTGSLSSSFF